MQQIVILFKRFIISIQNAKLSDFDGIKTFAAGSYGRVKLVRHKSTHQYYAMKILQKKKVLYD